MDKITVTNLIDFGKKGDKGKQSLVNKLKLPKVSNPNDGGGDYWISALSCLAKVFKDNTQNIIGDKIDELIEKIETHERKITKDMYQRNINILQEFEEFDFYILKPQTDLIYLKKTKEKSIVSIKQLPLFVNPHHVYTFKEDNVKKIGAIWFVAKLGGFKNEELAIVTDLLYRYLVTNYSDKFEISMSYTIAIDVNTAHIISYSHIENGEIKSTLIPVINEIKKLM